MIYAKGRNNNIAYRHNIKTKGFIKRVRLLAINTGEVIYPYTEVHKIIIG